MAWNDFQTDFSRLESAGGSLGTHLGNLAQAHEALLAKEVKGKVERLVIGGALFAITFALALTTIVVLSLALGGMIADVFDLSEWVGYLIMSVVLALVAAGSAVMGIKLMRRLSLLPHESITQFKETFRCLMRRS